MMHPPTARSAGPQPVQFSICIPVFNDAAWLSVAIEGVLAQTHGAWELVISDNASTDAIGAVVQSYDDDRIRYVRWPDHVTIFESHNRAMSLCAHPWLVPLGADDRLHPSCLARLAERIELAEASDRTLAVALTACRRIDASGASAAARYYGRSGAKRVPSGIYSASEWMAVAAMPGAPPWNTGSVAISRDALVRSGAWFRTDVGLSADNELLFRLSAFGDVDYIADPLLDYVVRSDSAGNSWFFLNRHRGEPETPLGAALRAAVTAHEARRLTAPGERKAVFLEIARLHLQRAGHHRILPGGRGFRGAALDLVRAVRAAPSLLASPRQLVRMAAVLTLPAPVLRWASRRLSQPSDTGEQARPG